MSASQALRTLGLAAALIAGAAAPSFAEGFDGVGPSAFPAWSQAQSRTPLAGQSHRPVDAQQNFLERSGATGSAGQHS